jgi:SAM-dependent methyltransferase
MPWDHLQSIKEVLKHIAFKTHLQGFITADRRRRGISIDYLNREMTSERFSNIYASGTWISSPSQKSSSGRGSEAESTGSLVRELPVLLDNLGCRTLLDVGCGDWNWMKEMSLPPRYIGVDIVEEVIAANRKYESEGVIFKVMNAVEEELPLADVILCREMLFHLSLDDGLAVLAKARASARWLIATTDPDIWFNSDIRTGDFRRINLQLRPFRLPQPSFVIPDGAIHPRRVLGVWSTEHLPIQQALSDPKPSRGPVK